jgi:(p)ppGpp synthase/HD superfamily hydrolase
MPYYPTIASELEEGNLIMISLIERAAAFAAHAHRDQKRQWIDKPYFSHVEEVAVLCKQFHLSEDVQAAAYLHDVIEDCGVKYADLEKEFGEAVARLVLEVSDVSNKEDGNRFVRKSIIDLQYLRGASVEGQSLKCCDLISNTSEIVELNPEFAKRYLPEKRLLLENALTNARYPVWKAAYASLVKAEKKLEALNV